MAITLSRKKAEVEDSIEDVAKALREAADGLSQDAETAVAQAAEAVRKAADVLATVKINQLERNGAKLTKEEIDAIRQPIIDKYESESTPYYSTTRLWDDGIVGMTETREALALGIAMSLNQPIPDQKYGVFRM